VRLYYRKSQKARLFIIAGVLALLSVTAVLIYQSSRSSANQVTITYDFEADTIGQAPSNITATNGTSTVVTGKAMSPQAADGELFSDSTAYFNLDLFPEATDYSVTWKEAYSEESRTAVLLRATGVSQLFDGAMTGYVVQANAVFGDVRIFSFNTNSNTLLGSAPLAAVAPGVGVERWYRGTVEGNVITMEYSTNGTDFSQALQVTDSTYSGPGTTQLGRGFNNPVTGTEIDDITFVNNDIPANDVSITNIPDYKIFQRDETDQVDIPISGTYAGEPTAIEASFNGSDWITIDANPSSGTFSGDFPGALVGQGTLSVRFVNDTEASYTVNNIGVGDIFIISGQSNASGRGFNEQTYTHPTLKASLFGNDDTWKELADPTDSDIGQIDSVSTDNISGSLDGGSPWPLVATQIMANHDVPVAFVPTAKGGTTATQWQPAVDNSDPSTLYGSMNRRIAAVGGTVAGVLWFQGESDANTAITSQAYQADLETIFDTLNANFPGTKTIVGQIGQSSFSGNDRIRSGQIQIVTDNSNALMGPTTYDINLADEGGDTLHFKSDGDLQLFADRWYAAIDKEIYGGLDGYGPIVDEILYSDSLNKLVATFVDESSPAIDPASSATAASFELRNGASEVGISSVSLTDDTVEITPSAPLDTGQSITLTYASLNDAVDQAIYDSNGLPAQPFYNETVGLNLAPQAPTDLEATRGNAQVSLSWTTPADTGTAAISDYLIEYSTDGNTWSTFNDGTSTNTSTTVTGLTNSTEYQFRVSAISADGTGSPSTTVSATPASTPVLSNIASTTTATSAVISWSSDIGTSTQVEYGPSNAYGMQTAVSNDEGARVTSHSVTLSDLVPCATYSYRVVSESVDILSATSARNTFTTPGCPGDATIVDRVIQTIPVTGGTVEDDNFELTFPDNFTNEGVTIQLNRLNKLEESATSKPGNNLFVIGSQVYSIKALTADGEVISNFNQPITITVQYTNSEVSGLVESSLRLYNLHEGSWEQLTDCVNNTTTNTISCTTDKFSVFAIFGTKTPASEPTAPVTIPGQQQPRQNFTNPTIAQANTDTEDDTETTTTTQESSDGGTQTNSESQPTEATTNDADEDEQSFIGWIIAAIVAGAAVLWAVVAGVRRKKQA